MKPGSPQTPLLVPAAGSMALEEPLAEYAREGWARLGRQPIANPDFLAALRTRADQIMLGEVSYPGLFFQHDAESGRYDELELGRGWVGPSLRYRKLEKLELDPLFRAFLENPLFGRIARAVIGADRGIALCRAVLFTKAAEGGSDLPWHQDGGRFWGLDRDPVLQLWTALDDAPPDSGCLEVVPRSHLQGLTSPMGGVVPAALVESSRANECALPVPARAGESLILHNHCWHRSGRNRTALPRRALTVCLMDARTRCLRKNGKPRQFLPLFEKGSEREERSCFADT